jgi:hypothetical protein
LEMRIAAKKESESKFWSAFLTVEDQPNAMSLAASIACGRPPPRFELCALCHDNHRKRKAIALCARCKKLLCEDCLEDFASCLCLACQVYTIHEKAASRQ